MTLFDSLCLRFTTGIFVASHFQHTTRTPAINRIILELKHRNSLTLLVYIILLQFNFILFYLLIAEQKCTKRWKSLRDKFAREMKLSTESRWRYFKQMSFLVESIR